MVTLTDRLEPRIDESLLGEDRNTVSLFAGANETVSVQLVIDAGPAGLEYVRVSSSDLQTPSDSTIGSNRLRFFRMLPVEVKDFPAWYLRLVPDTPQPAKFYDALVPVDSSEGGQPYDIAPDGRLAVWVDLSVPRTAEPGLYKGTIRVASLGQADQIIPIEVQVYDFVLPDSRPIAAIGGFDHRTLYRYFVRDNQGRPYEPVLLRTSNPLVAEGLPLIDQIMQAGHGHRLDLFDRAVRPKITRELDGTLALDWSHYDRIVTPYLDGSAFEDRIGSPAWPIPIRNDWPVPANYGGVESEVYAETLQTVTRLAGRHFRSLDAGSRMFAWPYRGAVSQRGYVLFDRLAEIIRKGDDGIAILCPLPVVPPRLTGWNRPDGFDDFVDILAPPANWLDPTGASDRRDPARPLRGVWLSPGNPPYLPGLSVLASPADVRAIPWFAMKYGCTGLFLPEVLHWGPDVFTSPADAETRLFYPGGPAGLRGVLPSARLKRLRRGLQDISYIWILQQRQRAGLARAIMHSMVRYAGLDAAGDHYLDPRINGWEQDPTLWIRARRMLAEEVQAAIHSPGPVSEADRIAERVRWHQFNERTHTLRVEQIRSSLRPMKQDGNSEDTPHLMEATIDVELYNEYDKEVSFQVQFEQLPPGWQAEETVVRVENLPAFQRHTVTLRCRGEMIPASRSGTMPLAIRLSSDAREDTVLRADVPFVLAGTFRTPPEIDGDLDDWPAHLNITAGDFRLLGLRGQLGQEPQRQSRVMVMQDDTYLYLAFRCEEPTPEAMTVRNSNAVHYEQLLACGEDLVEIVLDPGARARSPEDLYHLLIKPNGIVVEELGIRSSPPLGKARPVALGSTVAARRGTEAWTVELRIPFSAFGADGRENVWGANFTRFATVGQEASSWSGAARYFYDPRSLGTLLLETPTNEPDNRLPVRPRGLYSQPMFPED